MNRSMSCTLNLRIVARLLPALLLGGLSLSTLAVLLGTSATLACGQTPKQSTAGKHSPGGVISGKVQCDGLPAGEVQVSITPVRQSTGAMSFSALMARVDAQQTDDDGSFSVDGLAPGAYAIAVEAPGYIVTSGLMDEEGKQVYFRPGDQATIRMIKGGVITGRVTDSEGQPVVQVPINAVCLRDERGRPARASAKVFSGSGGVVTDDRGIYRLYGLNSGVYLVSTGRAEIGSPTPFSNDSPSYHPSGTVDAAAEVRVQAGQETGGVDISYSSIPGHSISGHLSGQFATGGLMSIGAVFLTQLKTGVAQAEALSMTDSHAFQMGGVPDGEYLLMAMSYSFGKDLTVAPPRRVVMKGSDVTGVDLTLGPITAISGKVVIQALKPQDQKSGCKSNTPGPVEEVVVVPHSSEKSKAGEQIPMILDLTESTSGYKTGPDAKGEFTAQLPGGGSYHLETELLGGDLFLSSVTLPAESADKPPKDASGGIAVKNSERISGVTVTVAQGAAQVSGRVVAAGSGTSLPPRLRVYLVPVEKEATDNTLRYYDGMARHDGSFELKHIAPGRYYVVTRPMSQEEWDEVNPRPIWWSAASRQKLRQEAEKANTVVELKACQQVNGLAIPFGASAPPSGPAKAPGVAGYF